jgi:hypothetical protein
MDPKRKKVGIKEVSLPFEKKKKRKGEEYIFVVKECLRVSFSSIEVTRLLSGCLWRENSSRAGLKRCWDVFFFLRGRRVMRSRQGSREN